MKKLFKILVILVAVVVLAIGSFYGYISLKGIPKYDPPETPDMKVEVTAERIERGTKLANMLCVQCHLNPETNKLTGKYLADMPASFGTAYSVNITQHPEKGIGSWTDGEIAYAIRTGLKPDGTYMPPWMVKLPRLADEDMNSIIAFLRSDAPVVQPSDAVAPKSNPSFLAKMLSNFAFKPLPYQDGYAMPDTNNPVALGKYLALDALDCYGCHSENFETFDALVPENTGGFFGGGNPMLNMEGEVLVSANITPHEKYGIGSWSEAEFIIALTTGRKPDGTAFRYPMMPYSGLTDKEATAIYAYLRTVPVLDNDPRAEAQ